MITTDPRYLGMQVHSAFVMWRYVLPGWPFVEAVSNTYSFTITR